MSLVKDSHTLHPTSDALDELAETHGIDPTAAITAAGVATYLLHKLGEGSSSVDDFMKELNELAAAADPAIEVPGFIAEWLELSEGQRREIQAHETFSVPPTFQSSRLGVAILAERDDPERFHAGFLWIVRYIDGNGLSTSLTLSMSAGEVRECREGFDQALREHETAERLLLRIGTTSA
jgi:hypothetical protein